MSGATLEFLTWVSMRPRTYRDVMEAWRTSCPRLTIWEDAVVANLVQIEQGKPLLESGVTLTPQGEAVLQEHHDQQVESPGPWSRCASA